MTRIVARGFGTAYMLIWNEMAEAKGLPRVMRISEKRKAAIRAREKEWADNAAIDPILPDFFDLFREAVEKMYHMNWILGNERHKPRTIDWLFRPDVVQRICEGEFDQRRSAVDQAIIDFEATRKGPDQIEH